MQQIGRAGRDGDEALCTSFFNEEDNFEVRSLIERSVTPMDAAWDIINRVVESSSPGGRPSLLCRAEWSMFDIHPRQSDTLLTLLYRVVVALAEKPAPDRFRVSPGTTSGDAGDVQCLSVPARALWQQHLCLLFEEPRSSRRVKGATTTVDEVDSCSVLAASCFFVLWCVSKKWDMAVFSFFLGPVAFCNGPIM